jgi:hypothetical protein
VGPKVGVIVEVEVRLGVAVFVALYGVVVGVADDSDVGLIPVVAVELDVRVGLG